MSDYKPKVGEAFLWRANNGKEWKGCGKAVFVSEKQVASLDSTGHLAPISLTHFFKKAPTKQEIEHNELFEIILDGKNQGATSGQIATNIQKLCYTKVKKVTREQVLNQLLAIKFLTKGNAYSICEILCDLFSEVVEDE